MRPDPHIALWDGERVDLGHGLTLPRTAGHFPGATVLRWAGGSDGAGTLLVGNVCIAVPDRRYVGSLWSYPDRVPLPAADVVRIGAVLAGVRYRTLYAAFWEQRDRRRGGGDQAQRCALRRRVADPGG